LQKANLEGFDNLNIVKTDEFGYYELKQGNYIMQLRLKLKLRVELFL